MNVSGLHSARKPFSGLFSVKPFLSFPLSWMNDQDNALFTLCPGHAADLAAIYA